MKEIGLFPCRKCGSDDIRFNKSGPNYICKSCGYQSKPTGKLAGDVRVLAAAIWNKK